MSSSRAVIVLKWKTSTPLDRLRRLRRWRRVLIVLLILLGALVYEAKTSALQSLLLSKYAHDASYKITPGRSPQIAFPTFGPFNDRLGYAHIPQFLRRLEDRGFRIREQAVFSPGLARLAAWGITPPYREPTAAGLVIHDAQGKVLYDARPARQVFPSFEAIPDEVVKSLLFIENRELDEPADRRANPVVEWDRLAKAGVVYAASKLGLPVHLQGGSTLATQLEKYRHSLHGQTYSAMDKIRQMTAAALWVYQDGTDTRARRREIVLDYLNTVPLAALPGYGEIHGLGEGLQAWFGQPLDKVLADLGTGKPLSVRARAFRQMLTLLCAERAPTLYLVHDPRALAGRVDYFAGQLAENGIIDPELALAVRKSSLRFAPNTKAPTAALRRSFVDAKSVNAVRSSLLQTLGIPSLYDLDRLHLDVETTLDPGLQEEVQNLFRQLRRPEFLSQNGLLGDRLLSNGTPEGVIYSFLLFERTPEGNALRVVADNLDQPLDLNAGMKLELGSTAKLRTLAHYLEVMASLHQELSGRDPVALDAAIRSARDPLTVWAAETLSQEGGADLDSFLAASLERKYSASPRESFFTGGGLHTFRNFDKAEDTRIMTVREGLVQSVNLVYIRLMRDLIHYHQARLSYDSRDVLTDAHSPLRKRMLSEIADEEARDTLRRAYQSYRGLSRSAMIDRLLGERARSPRALAVLFFAWKQGDDPKDLGRWLAGKLGSVEANQLPKLFRAYGNSGLSLSDYGYLLNTHPLDIWVAGQLLRRPKSSWDDLLMRSVEARRVSNAWLFETRNRQAQDLRLRIRIERDAFAAMTPFWKRVGFPFERLVPSYATAIGSSSDRPAALAVLMGIIVNDGLLRPTSWLRQLRFGEGTPYHTVVVPESADGERVMSASVARALRGVLSDVVTEGTARRVSGAFLGADGNPIEIGGKTGSGDNRFKTFRRGGGVIASRAVNRTATFVFEVGTRYYGVITAFVPGGDAEGYTFTSALPVSLLKLLAPAIERRWNAEDTGTRQGSETVRSETPDLPCSPPSGAAEISKTNVVSSTLGTGGRAQALKPLPHAASAMLDPPPAATVRPRVVR